MIPIKKMPGRVGKFTIDQAPTLLTAVGVTGTVLTAYLTGKASFRAAEILEAEQRHLDQHETSHPLESREKIEIVWKLYIPAVSVGIGTVTCIIYANRIGNRRAAAMAAAYTIAQQAANEYRDKVVETIGKNKEQKIRDEIVRDEIAANPASGQTIVLGQKHVRGYERKTGRYFPTNMEELRRAENKINHKILSEDYASLSDFYVLIGLPLTIDSDELGWRSGGRMLELDIQAALSDDEPVLAIHYNIEPVRNYWKAH